MPPILTGRNFGLKAIDLETGETVIGHFGNNETAGPVITPKQATRAHLWATGQGLLIQNALYDLSEDIREMFISGVSPEEWDKLYKEEDEQ